MTVAKWLFFSVLVALIPLGFTYVHLWIYHRSADPAPTWSDTIAHGELLLISVVLAADATGTLVFSGERTRLEIFAGCCCFVVVVFASLCFADVSVEKSSAANANVIFYISIAVFVMTVLCAGICKALGETA